MEQAILDDWVSQSVSQQCFQILEIAIASTELASLFTIHIRTFQEKNSNLVGKKEDDRGSGVAAEGGHQAVLEESEEGGWGEGECGCEEGGEKGGDGGGEEGGERGE